MTTVKTIVGRHEGETIVVIGTGPSAWSAMKDERFKAALQRHTLVAVNRAFDIGLMVQYQVSIDHVWTALLKTPAATASNRSLVYLYKRWVKQYDVSTAEFSFEDFIETFKHKLSIHPEVWRYYRLISAHAPFVRICPVSVANAAPYPAMAFVKAKSGPNPSRYDGLVTGGNSACPAIHLAAVLGARRIFLLGVDMTKPDKKTNTWETGPDYYRPLTQQTFKALAYGLCPKIQILNLNPDARLKEFQRVRDIEHGISLLEA